MNSSPLVSIGIPVYNEERYLASVLDAIVAQDYPNLEILISENWSTDQTAEIARQFAAQDSRIRVIRPATHVKSSENFIRALELGSGKYFVWVSGHDLLEPAYIRRCVELLETEPKVVLAYARAHFIDQDGQIVGTVPGNIDSRGSDPMSRFFQVLWGVEYGYPLHGVMRRDIMSRVFLKPIELPAPDYICLSELACHGEFAQIDAILMRFRIMHDYGSWEHYLNKLMTFSTTVSVTDIFLEVVDRFMQIIERHFSGNPQINLIKASLISCLYLKHVGILNGMLSTSHAKPGDRDRARQIIAQLDKAANDLIATNTVTPKSGIVSGALVKLLSGILK